MTQDELLKSDKMHRWFKDESINVYRCLLCNKEKAIEKELG